MKYRTIPQSWISIPVNEGLFRYNVTKVGSCPVYFKNLS